MLSLNSSQFGSNLRSSLSPEIAPCIDPAAPGMIKNIPFFQSKIVDVAKVKTLQLIKHIYSNC